MAQYYDQFAPEQNQQGMPMPPQNNTTVANQGMPPPPQGNAYTGQYSPFQNSDGTPVGGGSMYGQVSPADYGSVQNYADQAYDNSRRYIDPQQEQETRRLNQSLINKGIDPNSAQGQRMMEEMSMRQGDQNSASAFDALGFGQGIQDQMAQQALGWGAYGLGRDTLDMHRQGQNFGQMMDLDANEFRNTAYNDSQNQYRDQLYLAMYGQNPVPAGSTIDPDGSQTKGGWGWGYNMDGGDY
jgi:hypothetical protein